MKKKPDVLVVLAAVLGLGIAVSSVGNTGEAKAELKKKPAQVAEVHR